MNTIGAQPPRARDPGREFLRNGLAALILGIAAFIAGCVGGPGRGERQINYELTHQFAVEDPQFLRTMGQLLGAPLVSGNRVTAYQNGDEIFPPMLEAIHGARESVTFENYIFEAGVLGRRFTDAFCERARAGVKVHVLLDWLGTAKIDPTFLTDMAAAGVEVERYHPIAWYSLSRANNRTHRKLLVVDGRVGFTGGACIADPWLGDGTAPDHWRECHYRIEGPAVAQLQAVFIDNWMKTRAQVLLGPAYFPALTPAGPLLAQVCKSSRDEGSESVRLMYLLSIASATRTIRLQAGYFVPDDLAIQTLVTARQRGVRVEIIVPGPHSDSAIIQSAGRSRWAALLDAGVLIYAYQPSLYHSKVLIVDEVWVSVGSTNFDNRSFRLNDEANLNIYNAGFAAEQVVVFERDKSVSRRMTLADFKDRSVFRKAFDAVTGIFRQQF